MPTAGGCRYPQQQKHALRDVTQDVKRGRAGQRRWPAPFRQPRGGAVILRCCCGTPAGKPGNPGPGGARNMAPIRKPGVLSRSWRACRPPGRFPSSERGHRSCRRAPSCRRFRGLVACRCRSRAGRCCFSRRRRTPAGGLSRRASGPARTKALPPAPRRLRKRGKRRQRARRERRRQKRKSFLRPLHKPPSGPFPQMLPQHRSGRASGRTPARQEYIINIA